MDQRELARALEHESGLVALAGTADMRDVVAQRGGLALAIDVYLHRLRAHIAAMAAAIGGLDALVFTGGVGEPPPPGARRRPRRASSTSAWRWTPPRNARGEDATSARRRAVRVLVVEAREDLEIARGVRGVLGAG